MDFFLNSCPSSINQNVIKLYVATNCAPSRALRELLVFFLLFNLNFYNFIYLIRESSFFTESKLLRIRKNALFGNKRCSLYLKIAFHIFELFQDGISRFDFSELRFFRKYTPNFLIRVNFRCWRQ